MRGIVKKQRILLKEWFVSEDPRREKVVTQVSDWGWLYFGLKYARHMRLNCSQATGIDYSSIRHCIIYAMAFVAIAVVISVVEAVVETVAKILRKLNHGKARGRESKFSKRFES